MAVLLLAVEPLNFAGEALGVAPTIAYRGTLAIVELSAHAAVAALLAGAGLALWNGAPDARRIAAAAVVIWAGRVIQSLYWSVLPNDTVPGSEPFHAAMALGAAAVALLLIRRRSRPEAPQA